MITAGWLSTVETIDGRIYAHVTPLDDKVEHDQTGDCVCGPTMIQDVGRGNDYAWYWRHHSLDGRELVE